MTSWGKHSAQLKAVARLAQTGERRSQGRFLLEGVRVLEDFAASGLPLEHLLVDPARRGGSRVEALAQRYADCVVELEGALLERISPAETSQGVLGVAPLPRPPSGWWREAPALLVLENLQDPGNVGTLLRTARACGLPGVLARGGADPYGPKVVRSSAGSLFHLHLEEDFALDGFTLVAGAPAAGENLFDCRLPERPAFLVGNEGQGLSPELLRRADLVVRIPMAAGCESLNVAVSGSLLLYEWMRRGRLAQM